MPRLTFHGRLLIVQRYQQGWKQAHIADAMGVSRKCVGVWIRRSAVEGEVGVPPRTVARILRRQDAAYLSECDPMTGEVIRASKATAKRYERERPGELVHMDVKKLGKIPDGGGWRAHGRSEQVRGRGIGYDYVDSVVDDHSRLAYSEVLPDEKGATSAAFFARAVAYFAEHGVTVERVLTDNAFAYRNSLLMRQTCVDLGIKQKFIKPHCPWQNGKVERCNRTLQVEWAYRHVFTSSAERTAALAPWIENYNTRRRHSALRGLPPISRLEAGPRARRRRHGSSSGTCGGSRNSPWAGRVRI